MIKHVIFPIYCVPFNIWKMFVSFDVCSFQCGYDSFVLVHLPCVVKRGFVWWGCSLTLGSFDAPLYDISSNVCSLRALSDMSLFDERFVLCDAITYDALFYTTISIFNDFFNYIIHFKSEHEDWIVWSPCTFCLTTFSLVVSSNESCSLFILFLFELELHINELCHITIHLIMFVIIKNIYCFVYWLNIVYFKRGFVKD